jgi:purine-nucleoside phosphorylase
MMQDKLKQSSKFIQSLCGAQPKIGIILGSGLGNFVDQVSDKIVIPYKDIPFFKITTVEGHAGQLIFGNIKGVQIVVLQGRVHAYEGHSMEEVVFPVRLLAMLGISILILTNAAGGINLKYQPGDLVIIKDHINLMGKNPLIGPNQSEWGPRFPDMSHAYNLELKDILEETAKSLGQPLQLGVYAGVLGPSYETPAEIKMIRILGADMVGMSTIPETIAANHLGLRVCGVSCITNMGAGIIEQTLKHEDIKQEAFKVMDLFTNLLTHSIEKFGKL